MKKQMMRVLALGLAAALALPPAALASDALGSELHKVTVPLARGTEVVKQSLWSATYSDLRTERYLTYTPTEGVRPALAYGSKISTRATLNDMAKDLESQGKRVLGGLNGDYYVMASGVPLGLVMTDGVVRSTPQYTNSWALGFLPDGTAFISQPEMSLTANFKGMTLAVSGGINKARTVSGGYYLLTDEFADNTKNTQPGVDVILRPLQEKLGELVEADEDVTQVEEGDPAALPEENEGQGEPAAGETLPGGEETTPGQEEPKTVKATLTRSDVFRPGSRVTCEVVEVLHTDQAMAIPEGCYVLTINKKGNEWLIEQLAGLTPGERVELDLVAKDTRWNEAVTGIGGMYKLVTNGVVESGLEKERAPRSAVGIKADGSTVFYTIDGRQAGYSVGATLTQVAQRLVELGCVEAVCMDGGGSTTFGVTWPDAGALEVTNRPSDGAQRPNSNALFLVSELEPTGELDHFYLTPNDTVLLAGSSIQMEVQGMDTNYLPMEWEGGVDWSVLNGDGTVTADGIFTAGEGSGAAAVTASAGEITGSAGITVVKNPDAIRLTDETTGGAVAELMLEPNQTVDLKAECVYRNLPVISQDKSYVWTADPAVGQVDENGLFTAAASSGTGNLTVSAGGKSVVVPVTVTGHILPLEDFETSVMNLIGTQTAQAESEANLEYVRFGAKSAKVTYDASGGTAILASTLPVRKGERFLTLWVYGDGSGNALMASVADGEGNQSDVPLTGLDFQGWKRVTAVLPEGTVNVLGFPIVFGGTGPSDGTLWLDQITTANEQVVDEDAPDIVVEVGNGSMTATVTDALDKDLLKQNLTVSLDGAPLTFTWEPKTAKITAPLPVDDGKLHRVTVTACDASGNLARASSSFSAVTEWTEPFADMGGHWAQGFTAYLYQQGITNGVQTEMGLQFQPEKAISRGEFALMVTRWQGLDLAGYEDVELPFADAGQIPAWMLPAVKAMYAQGVMKGSLEGENLYARAENGISRTEAMTILGRIQRKGYPAPALTFEDAGQVPGWALEYVQTLVAQGVVGGYENKLNPANQVKRCEMAKMLVALM